MDSVIAADVVFQTGGTTFVEAYWLEPKFFELDLARCLGKPVVMLTQSLGPFHDPTNQRGMRRVIGSSAMVLLRDEHSLENLRSIDVDVRRCLVVPDIVFALTRESAGKHLLERRVGGQPHVIISVRDLTNYRELRSSYQLYADGMRALVIELVEVLHATVAFMSTCQGIDEYWTDDSQMAAQIFESLPEHVRGSVTVDRSARSTGELMDEYARADVVVATRLHAAILALTAGTWVVPIAYEFKTHTVFAGLGLPEMVLDAKSVTPRNLISHFNKCMAEEERIRGVLSQSVPRIATDAAAVGNIARELLEQLGETEDGAPGVSEGQFSARRSDSRP